MAKFKRNVRKTKKKYSKVEEFAYMLGLVNRGLDKGGNKVTDSYERGNKDRERRVRKPLI